MITPMLAKLVKAPFDDPEWVFEIKWDGYRAIATKTKSVQIFSRNHKSFNARFPAIVQELGKLPAKFIVDGEIVILDKKGRSQFQLLQNYEEKKEGTPLYYLFDILSYEGKDLTPLPLLERKEILCRLLGKRKWTYLRYSDHLEQYGKKLFALAEKKHYEGIIAKRKSSRYLQKRSSDWLKIKTSLRQEVVIGGFTEPRGSRKYFGSLLVGVYDKGKLVYAGHVGGGFNQTLLQSTYRQMAKLKVAKSPFTTSPKANAPVTWIKPKLVCEVSFTEWTSAGMMRHPIFHGLRIDKPPSKVVREIY